MIQLDALDTYIPLMGLISFFFDHFTCISTYCLSRVSGHLDALTREKPLSHLAHININRQAEISGRTGNGNK